MARRSARRRFDDDLEDPPVLDTTKPVYQRVNQPGADPQEPAWSTYPDGAHGPSPTPSWVITSPAAIDIDLGVLKSGKEADVSLLRRDHGNASSLMAMKRYRSAEHRMFHRDAGYLEGRRTRYSRENRAMDTRTDFGRQLIAGQWAVAEFSVLARLWSAGAAVPYPVQLTGTGLMMEFIGDGDGVAAQRLAQLRPSRLEAKDLFAQLREALLALARAGYSHGDLSAYNILVHRGRVVLIDLPQAVDVVGNPQGFAFLERDCVNVGTWFLAHGLDVDVDALVGDLRHELRG